MYMNNATSTSAEVVLSIWEVRVTDATGTEHTVESADSKRAAAQIALAYITSGCLVRIVFAS